jgi:hypothetical protein
MPAESHLKMRPHHSNQAPGTGPPSSPENTGFLAKARGDTGVRRSQRRGELLSDDDDITGFWDALIVLCRCTLPRRSLPAGELAVRARLEGSLVVEEKRAEGLLRGLWAQGPGFSTKIQYSTVLYESTFSSDSILISALTTY